MSFKLDFRWLQTVRWKFLAAALAAVALTAATLYGLYLLAQYLIKIPFFHVPMAPAINRVGSTPILIVLGTVLFFVYYFLFSRSTIRRLEELDAALRGMENGELVPGTLTPSKDELGQAAGSIDRLGKKLTEYSERITEGLQAVASGRLEYRIEADRSYGDLARIADSINAMAEQLDRSIRDERHAEKTKNDLITGVSHDLRTPLTSILGFLEVIEQDRYKDEVELRHYVNIAYEKARSLKKLIDDLFEYTRIGGGMPLAWTALDLTGLLRQLAEEFVPILEKASMTCRLAAPEALLVIEGDGNLLVRAFENLVSNAIAHGSGSPYVDIQIERREDIALIRIINYGEPIPAMDLPFIFDRFYRGDRSRASGGTGLGLAIVKSIAEVHGGRVDARSDRSRTVFEISLPVARSS
ncbi:sensor histidine kinase [Cohnella hashimotonis]|uniref:histidine kinase n=1 Tax=Cohnella hashimotonis TaxID=2826895 RepID=A0ABT6TKQ6_9BACL|nr:HAMP domain-containing sensor histidine kinase [Cohnella hashimotonis]MDI4647422.1 HAMP domain-containing sensor histidine kinase [Cohnella hashimotonis]